jgi:hypothetical protein
MKALKLSSIALLLFSIFSSCTKDTCSLDDPSLLSSRSGGPSGIGNTDVTPLLKVVFNPDPAVLNQTVTVTGTFTSAPMPDCGKLQLFQQINGDWVKVADADLSASVHEVSYDFVPAIAGDDVYEFRVHYIPSGGCTGFSQTFSDSYYLDVENQCVSAFTIIPSISAVNLNNGLYEFNISYTLISPVDVNDIKFQGGATAGGNVGHQVTDFGNTVVVNANNNNTVLKWEGNLTACTPQVVSFKFTRNFSCPATDALITGAWSASAGGAVLGSIASLPYSCQ